MSRPSKRPLTAETAETTGDRATSPDREEALRWLNAQLRWEATLVALRDRDARPSATSAPSVEGSQDAGRQEIPEQAAARALRCSTVPSAIERSDEQLVVAAAGGDHDSFGALYDRYGARIYQLCARMLHNEDEAADATADVFVAAHEHLGQLRDPTKCKSWLYAIARNQVYRRTRHVRREIVTNIRDSFGPLVHRDDVAALDDDALPGLVRDAALGLDDRDRFILELTLTRDLDARELGAVLGVSESAAHQAVHRMRERLERSIAALLVARHGGVDCTEVATLLEPWDGTFSVLWRKRVARHVDGCATCDRRRRAVPAMLFSGIEYEVSETQGFAALAPAMIPLPADLRTRVMQRTQDATTQHGGWRRDGFPRVRNNGV